VFSMFFFFFLGEFDRELGLAIWVTHFTNFFFYFVCVFSSRPMDEEPAVSNSSFTQAHMCVVNVLLYLKACPFMCL
jgi:hypothetical protein